MLNGIVSRLRAREVRPWHGSVEKPTLPLPAEAEQARCCPPVTSYKDDVLMRPRRRCLFLLLFHRIANQKKKIKNKKKPAIRAHNEFKSAA